MLSASQVDGMAAGPALDELVEETLMGACAHADLESISYQGRNGWVAVVRCAQCGAVPPFRRDAPPYSTDLNAAYTVEERIEEMRLSEAYAKELSALVAASTAGYFASRHSQEKEFFLVAHASPDIRCKAALKAAIVRGVATAR